MRIVPFVLVTLASAVVTLADDHCKADEYWSPNMMRCEPKKGAGDSCNMVIRCKEPMECVDFKCKATCAAMEPPIPGIMPGIERPKLVLSVDIDYPPYGLLVIPPDGEYEVGGFGPDFAKGLMDVCDIDVVVPEIPWGDCWDSGRIGTGLKRGELHGCMTYTHTQGVRNRYLEFSNAILAMNKPAGLLVRLDANGNPEVPSSSNMEGLVVADVVGWAPTADTLALNTNVCTGETFGGFTMISPEGESGRENDAALAALMSGEADAVWIYADQAKLYKDGCADSTVAEDWDCDMWNQFGETFAYAHTGLFDYARNGTTLTISKKGSGLAEIVNPCIDLFMQTEGYWKICEKWPDITAACYPNQYFPAGTVPEKGPYFRPTNEQTGDCSDGYCSC